MGRGGGKVEKHRRFSCRRGKGRGLGDGVNCRSRTYLLPSRRTRETTAGRGYIPARTPPTAPEGGRFSLPISAEHFARKKDRGRAEAALIVRRWCETAPVER